VLDSVRTGSFKLLGDDERPAIALCGGWLIGVSSVDVLRRLLASADALEGPPEWASRLATHDDAIACGWGRLPEASDLLTKALAGYTLVSLLQSGTGASRRYDTVQLKTAIRVLGQLGQCSFGLDSSDSNAVLRVELTLPSEAGSRR